MKPKTAWSDSGLGAMGCAGLLAACAAAAVALAPVPSALARGGFIFGFDVGGATVSGERGVDLKDYPTCNGNDACDVRSDTGSGFAFGLHFGYNVLGYGGIELAGFGHGNKDSGKGKWEGSGHGSVVARVCPLQFFRQLDERKYDTSLYVGYTIISYNGYHIKRFGDGRGWRGDGLPFGITGEYYVNESIAVGVDLRFVKPWYNEYIYNLDDDITFTPESEPSTLVFAPMATLTFRVPGSW